MEARKAERSKEWNKALWRVNCCISLLFLLLTHYAAMYPIRRLHKQYDQIWRFIWLWATFQSLWKQFICPNLPHSYTIFVKVSKSLIFLVKSFLGNFYRHLATFYWSHCSKKPWLGRTVLEQISIKINLQAKKIHYNLISAIRAFSAFIISICQNWGNIMPQSMPQNLFLFLHDCQNSILFSFHDWQIAISSCSQGCGVMVRVIEGVIPWFTSYF